MTEKGLAQRYKDIVILFQRCKVCNYKYSFVSFCPLVVAKDCRQRSPAFILAWQRN